MIGECRELLRRYGIRPRRRLGQNFIVSRGAVEAILRALDPRPGETVYEVGAGLGTLTEAVAGRGAYVVAVEIDRRLVRALRDRFRGHPLVDVVHSDALALPLPRVDKVVSNVPYSISSKLVIKLLREQSYSLAVLTLQREFALRLLAEPGSGNYGRLSAITQLFAEVEPVGSISRRAFYPRPEVDSLIVRLRPRGGPLQLFGRIEALTSILFSKRRKKLSRALREAGLDPSLAEGLVDAEKRVYELTPAEVLRLAEALEPRDTGVLRGC